jgi:DNA polymerase III delta subunit
VSGGPTPAPFASWLEGAPAPAYLLAAEGAGLADLLGELLLERLRAKGNGAELLRLTAPDMEREPGAIEAEWRSPSFFAAARIFVLPDAGELKKAPRQEVTSYLGRPDPSVTLVIPCADRRAAKAFSSLSAVRTASIRENEAISVLASYAVEAARRSGVGLQREHAVFLVRWVGIDFPRLKEELDKLVTFSGGKGAIGEEAIRQVCVARGGVDPFKLAEALLSGDAPRCLLMFRAFAAGADSQDYHALLGAVAWKTRMEAGRKGGLPAGRAGRILSALSRLDRGLKGESGLSPEQIFEMSLLRLLG